MNNFTAVFAMETVGSYNTFPEAFKVIYDKITLLFSEGKKLSWQVLETTVWIETPEQIPVYFPEARDRMCQVGYLVNGKWVNLDE